LDSLHPSRPSPVSRWVLRVFPRLCAPRALGPTPSGPNGPEAPRMRLPAPSALASREIRRVNSPLVRHPRLRPLPPVLPPTSAARFQPVDMFRPRGFSPPRRVAPQKSPGLVASRYRKEFAAFRHRSRHSPPDTSEEVLARVRSTTAFPAAPFTPLEEVPPPAAASHHCDRCPLAVAPPPSSSRASSKWNEAATLDLGALLRHRVRCARFPLPVTHALFFLGFVPLQGTG
jgi:hypothetical protein